MSVRALRWGALWCLSAWSCGAPRAANVAEQPGPATAAPGVSASAAQPTSVSSGTPAKPLNAPAKPLLLVTDGRVLAALEARGLSLSSRLGIESRERTPNAVLSSNAAYDSIARVIEREVRAHAARDAQAGVGVHRYPHRLFDAHWLRSETARFELVALVNRTDRMPFRAGFCGETRLVYRLAYSTRVGQSPVASRLPATVALEIAAPSGKNGCADAARRWLPPAGTEGEALAEFLTGDEGPLAPELVDPGVSHKVVANVQLVRWPSTVRPDLGGHAEYLLLAFERQGTTGPYASAPLENTPDVDRLKADPALKRALIDHLSSERAAAELDQGTLVLPQTFLAKRAVSVTPRGLARKQNRPFSSLFSARELESFAPKGGTRVKSLEGALRRLDAMSCQGCHEARSVAGFHLLGEDPADAPLGTALASGASPHVLGDLERRARVIDRILLGASPDLSQGFPERSGGGYGAHCGLGSDATFRDWTCDAGLVCRAYDAPRGDSVGQCLPAAPRAAGDPCEHGPLAANADGTRDRVSSAVKEPCGERAVCNRNAVGFPGGMCTETCETLSPGSACGAIAVLEPFNACVARGEPFFDCLRSHAHPAGLRACDSENPCRDDYVCVRGAAGSERASGACIPPYFLFQLRVDGHP